MKVLEIIEQNGAEIAFPTTTLNFPENRTEPDGTGAPGGEIIRVGREAEKVWLAPGT